MLAVQQYKVEQSNGVYHTNTTKLFYCVFRKSSCSHSILIRAQSFQNHGSVRNAKESGKQATTIGQEQRVFNYFIWTLSTALSRAELYLGVAWSLIHYLLRRRLHGFPGKLEIVKPLEGHYYTARNHCFTWCLQNIQRDASFLNCIIYSDDCPCHVNRKVNKHNVRFLQTEKPSWLRKMIIQWNQPSCCALSVNQAMVRTIRLPGTFGGFKNVPWNPYF